ESLAFAVLRDGDGWWTARNDRDGPCRPEHGDTGVAGSGEQRLLQLWKVDTPQDVRRRDILAPRDQVGQDAAFIHLPVRQWPRAACWQQVVDAQVLRDRRAPREQRVAPDAVPERRLALDERNAHPGARKDDGQGRA